MKKLRNKICILILAASLVLGGGLAAQIVGQPMEQVSATVVTSNEEGNDDTEALTTIEDSDTPLSPGTSWAATNLVLMFVTLIEFLFMITEVIFHRKEDLEAKKRAEENSQPEINRKRILRLLSIPIAFVSIVEFLITEDMQAEMVMTDMYTVIMVILFAVQTALLLLSNMRQKAVSRA